MEILKTGIRTFIVLMMAAVVLTGCTRESSKSELTISLPSQSQSSQTVGSYLSMILLNIHIPGKSVLVHEFDFEHGSSTLTMTDPVTLVVPDLPSANGVLIQVLGVYETQNGVMQFTYGDTVTDFKGGPVTANILAQTFGSASKEGQVGGRYFTSLSGGPTGTMTGYFKPPNNRPPMAVDQSSIYNGWFQVFLLDGTNGITYVLDQTGETIFDNATLSSTLFSTPAAHVLKVNKPVTYRQQYNSSETEVDGEQDFILGFFEKPGTGFSFSGYESCYSSYDEAVPNVFTDVALTSPLVYKNAGSAGEARRIGGGVSKTFTQMFDGAGCDTSGGTKLALYPHRLNSGHDAALGMRGPFKLLNPLSRWGGYIDAKFQSAPDKISLKWDYLNGVETTAVTGVSIYYKFQQYGGGDGGGHNLSCQEYAAKQGFAFLTDTTGETYDFTSGVTTNNYYGFRFILCPYKEDAGTRFYFSDYIQSDCIGGCEDNQHFGWGVTDATVSANTSFTAAPIGGAYRRVNDVDASNANYTTLNLATGGGTFPAGGEVLLHITGEGLNASCGNHNGWDIGTERYSFSRIIYSDSVTVKIPKGTFADSMDALVNLDDPAMANADYCYLQVVYVPHFRNLTIDAGFAVTASPFLFGTGGGGIVALRVGGTLTMGASSSFDVSGKGYAGATAPNYHGSGHIGPDNNTNPTYNGGMSTSSEGGGGGGAYGDGADSFNGAMGGNGYSGGGGGGGFTPIRFGGGGGFGSDTAGSGGGAIYLAATTLNTSSGVLWADGTAPAGLDSGGGGGGTAILIAKTVTGSGFNIHANGGNGDTDGGVGGGGYIKALYCSATSVSWNILNNKGSTGNLTNGMSGNTDTTAGPNDIHFCPQP